VHDNFFKEINKCFSGLLLYAILYVYITFSIVMGGNMNQKNTLEELQDRKKQILQEIGALDDFRQGSLSPRYRKCGKSYCHCAKEGAQGHGPLWMVTRAVKGKTVSKAIPLEQVENTFAQIDRFHQFQKLIREYTEVNIKICDAGLESEKTASREAEKRG
jgi:hypothetical protein